MLKKKNICYQTPGDSRRSFTRNKAHAIWKILSAFRRNKLTLAPAFGRRRDGAPGPHRAAERVLVLRSAARRVVPVRVAFIIDELLPLLLRAQNVRAEWWGTVRSRR